MPIFNVGAAGTSDSGFNVDNSLRFDSGSSDYLNRTPGSTSDTKTWTWSSWIKFNSINPDVNSWIFGAYSSASLNTKIYLDINNNINVHTEGGGTVYRVQTDAVFRDFSAWYHVCVAFDTTQGTEANRIKIYVNETQQSLTEEASGYPPADWDGIVNNSSHAHNIGYGVEGSVYFDGYLCETVFIDGLALTPTDFGEFDEDSGIWKPIDVSGLTFGTNGFYLDFENSGALGDDVSGNGNDFTVNNLTAIDQSTDTCTNNYCTLNPLTARGGGTFEEGNLKYTASTGDSSIFGTIGIPPGMKVYFEVKLVNNTAQNAIGIHNEYDPGGTFVKGGSASGMYSFKPRGSASVTQYFNNGSSTNTATSNYANDTIIGVAVDNENGQIHYHVNGTYINSSDPTDNNPAALVTGFGGSSEQYLHFSLDTTTSQPINQFNFGSPPYTISSGNLDENNHGNFEYAVPSGYLSLCTKNLSEVLG